MYWLTRRPQLLAAFAGHSRRQAVFGVPAVSGVGCVVVQRPIRVQPQLARVVGDQRHGDHGRPNRRAISAMPAPATSILNTTLGQGGRGARLHRHGQHSWVLLTAGVGPVQPRSDGSVSQFVTLDYAAVMVNRPVPGDDLARVCWSSITVTAPTPACRVLVCSTHFRHQCCCSLLVCPERDHDGYRVAHDAV